MTRGGSSHLRGMRQRKKGKRGDGRMGLMEQLRGRFSRNEEKVNFAEAAEAMQEQKRETFTLSNPGQIAFWLGSEAGSRIAEAWLGEF